MTPDFSLSKNIGLRLRAARKAAGFKSAREFTDKYEIPSSTYCQHETGKNILNAETIIYYCELFNIEPAWLLTGKGFPFSFQYDVKCDSRLREEIIRKELGFQGNSLYTFPIEKNQPFALMDVKLFSELLREALPVYEQSASHVPCDDFIDFLFDVYNNIATTSADENARKVMINLSINSLVRGTKDNKKVSQNKHIKEN